MQDKTKNEIITIGFAIILILVFVLNILDKDKIVSTAERRRLAQFPEISISKIIDGEAIDKFEKYTVDQFVGRDFLRSLKSFYSMNILGQSDNNDLFVVDNGIYKMEYPLNFKNIRSSMQKINEVCEKYLNDMDVYYSIIPEKNFYLKNDNHLIGDYQEVKNIAGEELANLKYIDIWNCLELEDFYRTDLHWKQENLQDVVQKIKEDMNLQINDSKYEIIDMGEFFGTYYGQLGVKIPADKLNILTNEEIENCETFNFETEKYGRVYESAVTSDKYDIFLSGATSLIEIENVNSNSEKELLLFRDSFGSSLAPLLIDNYRKITLIDLRYISSKILNEYIDFNNQDVLFLYSSTVLNQNILK